MKKNENTVLWWLGWITLTIFSFFVSCHFWTGFIARHVGSMDKTSAPILWVAAVFGSWIVFLVPLIIVMYAKVDKAYEDARIRRETTALNKAKTEWGVKSILVPESERLLSKALTNKLKKIPESIRHGHLVTVTLKGGKKIENVFVMGKRDVLGIYDVDKMPFAVKDIEDIRPADLDKLPVFEAEKWLRLDGIGG